MKWFWERRQQDPISKRKRLFHGVAEVDDLPPACCFCSKREPIFCERALLQGRSFQSLPSSLLNIHPGLPGHSGLSPNSNAGRGPRLRPAPPFLPASLPVAHPDRSAHSAQLALFLSPWPLPRSFLLPGRPLLPPGIPDRPSCFRLDSASARKPRLSLLSLVSSHSPLCSAPCRAESG